MADVLGLDRNMHEAYQLLLHEGAACAARVSDRLGIPRAQADAALSRLEAASLIAPAPDNPTRVVPLDPRRGLAPLIARRQAQLIAKRHELSRSQEAFAALTAAYTGQDRAGSPPPSTLPPGGTAVRVQVEDMLDASQSVVMCILDEDTRAIALDVSSRAIEEARDRGVLIKAVYAGSLLGDDRIRAHARRLVSLGGRARTSTSLPPAMLVVDRTTALVPADVDTRTTSVVHNRALAGALASLFDRVWFDARTAAPPAVTLADAPSPQERDLLVLLGKGLTDASAARQLGVSLRTVRRMMAELMARLHARSRFEAGIRAAERGWIGSAPGATPLRRAIGRRPSPPGTAAAING